MAAAGRIEFAQGRGGSRHGLGGPPGERRIPIADWVGDERVEAEWSSVSPRAVAAAFPEAIHQLRDWTILSYRLITRKDLERSFRSSILVQGLALTQGSFAIFS